ncbi:MAG: VOC family protein [Candidatus Kapabacteria bacterium]|nr:VOC family protein [Candidatus Kapabacteria bacterium]
MESTTTSLGTLPDGTELQIAGDTVTGIGLATITVDDYAAALHFYCDIMGLQGIHPMNEQSCYIALNQTQGIYVIGGRERIATPARATRTTVALEVISATAMFARLRSKGIAIPFDEPMQMNDTTWWFYCTDPAGNQIECIGGR